MIDFADYDVVWNSKTKTLTIMKDTETVTINGNEAIEANKRRVLENDLAAYGFERRQHEEVVWWERVLVKASLCFDELVVCYTPELNEFYLDPYTHLRFTDFGKVIRLIEAFTNCKIKQL